jgi:hypothetical protein
MVFFEIRRPETVELVFGYGDAGGPEDLVPLGW